MNYYFFLTQQHLRSQADSVQRLAQQETWAAPALKETPPILGKDGEGSPPHSYAWETAAS